MNKVLKDAVSQFLASYHSYRSLEAYQGACQTPMMELFTKIIIGFLYSRKDKNSRGFLLSAGYGKPIIKIYVAASIKTLKQATSC